MGSIKFQSILPATPLDMHFRLAGFPTRISVFFWLIAALFCASESVPVTLAYMGCMAVSILVHELGHALSYRRFTGQAGEIVIEALGGLFNPQQSMKVPRQELWMLFWGPLAGFILGTLALIPLLLLHFEVWTLLDADAKFWLPRVLTFTVTINFFWSVLNLLPVFPLDGGRMLLTWTLWKRPHKGAVWVFTVSTFTALGVVAAGVVLLIATGILLLVMMLMFAVLAYMSWDLRKKIVAMGGYLPEDEDEAPREAWEQDPDWWKKG